MAFLVASCEAAGFADIAWKNYGFERHPSGGLQLQSRTRIHTRPRSGWTSYLRSGRDADGAPRRLSGMLGWRSPMSNSTSPISGVASSPVTGRVASRVPAPDLLTQPLHALPEVTLNVGRPPSALQQVGVDLRFHFR